MARLELIVQPRRERPTTSGRSTGTDLCVDDEEVGREQFRIDLDETGAWLEAIGRTNQTLVDDQVVPPGMRRPLFDGTTIRVGRTRFTVRDATATTDAPPPAAAGPEMTMVARGPIGRMPPTETTPPPAPEPAEPRPAGRTGDASPLHTRPAPRPGAAPRAGPPPVEPEQTMAFHSRPYRPGQAMPPSDTEPPPSPKPPPSAKPSPKPPPKPQPDAPRPPAAKAPQAPPPPQAPGRPTTVAVAPADIERELGADVASPPVAADVAARLQDGAPRLFVKCDGMKRRVRLLQARNAIGRAESIAVHLPNDSVSELHAEITFDGGTWTLRDRGSTNGSFVDGAHLRGDSRALQRHSLIGLGNVRAVFLIDDANAAAAQRLERRAMRLLVQAGRLTADAAREAVRIARADASQSIAEVLLMDTPLTAAEWATAAATPKNQRSVLDVLADLLARLRPGTRKAPPAR